MLERAGHHQEAERWKHGHLTLKEQREKALERNDLDYAQACDHEPSRHKGAELCQMEKRGLVPDITERREQETQAATARTAELEKLIIELEATSKELEREEKQRQRAAHLAATLYDRGDMVSQQQDANRDHANRQALLNKNHNQPRRDHKPDKQP